jgi:hypothetical protein
MWTYSYWTDRTIFPKEYSRNIKVTEKVLNGAVLKTA